VSREVRFSFKTEAEKADFQSYAEARGLTLSAFVKYAAFSVKEKYSFGAHHPVTGKPRGRPRKPKAGAKHVENGDKPVPRFYSASRANLTGEEVSRKASS
jgi:hypothetical protein